MLIEPIQKKTTISDFFESTGIKASTSRSDFWKHVSAVDPILSEELEPLFSRKKNGNLYEVKNRTLSFSLAVESWTISFHTALLNWFNSQKQLKPKRILEIGCDNGLMACWYATHFPDAEIIGIDQEKNGIRCAEQLASQLELNNISFFKMDFAELQEYFLEDSFDLIISVRTFHEIMGPVLISKYWSLAEYLKGAPMYGDRTYMQIVENLLTEDGAYLSCERLENPGDLGKWANLLHEADLNVQWDQSDIIDFQELGKNKRSPVIFATKKETGIATIDGLEYLYTRNSNPFLVEGKSLKGAKAEFAFHHLLNKKFHTGRHLEATNHWYRFRFEIWETRTLLLVYCCGNMGHRHLDILPAGAYHDAEVLLEEVIESFIHLGSLVSYNSLQEIPR
ncbi:methyltransferase domain-containing protein [Neobacillus sp. Marseille-QA0830]